MRTNLEDVKITGSRHGKGRVYESTTMAPVTGQTSGPGNAVISADLPALVFLNPGAAATVLMPTSSLARQGLTFMFVNISANTVTFQTDGGAAFASAVAVTTGQMAIAVCTGNATQNLGWRFMTAAGTQTSP